MTYQQYRAVRRLVHECCNYQDGNCLLLDDGEECVCPQSIFYSLICRWFRAAVLPLVPGRCPAAGRKPVRRPALSGEHEEMRPMRRLVHPQIQPGQILP